MSELFTHFSQDAQDMVQKSRKNLNKEINLFQFYHGEEAKSLGIID